MTEQLTRRQRRKTLSDRQVAALPKKRKRYIVADPEMAGHYVRVMPTGPNVFVAVCRDPYGKQIWHTVGSTDVLKVTEARDRAREAIKRIKAGLPPVEAPPVKPDAFRTIAENWLKRRVVANGFRTEAELRRCLNVYVYPRWGNRPFVDIRRSDVNALLDHIVDNHGARMADIVLSVIRAIGNWYATTTDDFTNPVARGMRRDAAKPRERILSDDELRKVWKAAETGGTFGALVRVLLLTSQRSGVVLQMRHDAISDGVWEIRAEAREKNNAGSLTLPRQALDIIRAQPKLGSNPHVFASPRGDGPLGSLTGPKEALDKASGVSGWTLHDLRRTARSLMSRAGVPSEHAERTLGHVIRGVAGIYDRHGYSPEKAAALAKLAALIDEIVNPSDDRKVVVLRPVATQP